MINIFIFLGALFLLTFVIGKQIEKIRVPWIFASLLLGTLLAIYNPFKSITSSETFEFMSQLGMYFLLFIIGFEINLKKLKKIGSFIFRATFFIIFLEGVMGSLLIHFVFGYSWFIAFLVALSFATVGEAILIPILDEFKIINTKLGQSIIGIGTLDDIIEFILLIIVIFLTGSTGNHQINIFSITISFSFLFIIIFIIKRLKIKIQKFTHLSIENLFLLTLSIFFLFIGIGKYIQIEIITALLAGVILKNFLPKEKLLKIESEIKSLCYGFFAPIFFLSVGVEMDMGYLIKYPLLILLVVSVAKTGKLLASYLIAKNTLGTKKSILLGIGLSVRFSTSIIIIKILFDNGLIKSDLFSIIIASSIVFKFLVPILFSNLLVKWKVKKNAV
ncbi:MAG: cation:proton antiporter [Patescibacteria group bacterium]|nr:cation:proton antiporter [Patescibacteria group bacterium]